VRYYGIVSGRSLRFHRHGGSYSSPYIYDMQNPFNTAEWHGVWYSDTNFSFCG
jgi:hypothetical protein